MATRAKRIPGVNRVSMMVRIAPALRQRVEDNASISGRSLGQEIELLISQSLRDEELRTLIREEIRAALAEREQSPSEMLAEAQAMMGV